MLQLSSVAWVEMIDRFRLVTIYIETKWMVDPASAGSHPSRPGGLSSQEFRARSPRHDGNRFPAVVSFRESAPLDLKFPGTVLFAKLDEFIDLVS